MRNLIAITTVMLATVAVTSADEITGVVTKFEDGKITFIDFKAIMAKKAEGGKAEETTVKVAPNVKVLKGKVNMDGGFTIEADGDFEGGKEAFAKAVKDAAGKKMEGDNKKADDKKAEDKKGGGKKGGFGGMFGGGLPAQIITEGEGDNAKVTEIRVFQLNLKKKGG